MFSQWPSAIDISQRNLRNYSSLRSTSSATIFLNSGGSFTTAPLPYPNTQRFKSFSPPHNHLQRHRSILMLMQLLRRMPAPLSDVRSRLRIKPNPHFHRNTPHLMLKNHLQVFLWRLKVRLTLKDAVQQLQFPIRSTRNHRTSSRLWHQPINIGVSAPGKCAANRGGPEPFQSQHPGWRCSSASIPVLTPAGIPPVDAR